MASLSIHDAVKTGNLMATRDLLLEDRDLVNSLHDYGNTPLHYAALNGDLEIAELLIDFGAKTTMRNEWGNFPVHLAAGHGKWETLVMLVSSDHGTLNAPGNQSATPIHMASGNGHKHTVDALLQLGSAPILPDDDGDTPLHLAAMFGKIAVAEYLIGQGASIDVRNKKGYSAVEVARDQKIADAMVNKARGPLLKKDEDAVDISPYLAEDGAPDTLFLDEGTRATADVKGEGDKPVTKTRGKKERKKQSLMGDLDNVVDQIGALEMRKTSRRNLME